jgi:tetratricopeptide (TPR) repeat protein
LNAVRAAAPFSPLPRGSKKDIDVEFSFTYNCNKPAPVDNSNSEVELALLRKAIETTPENGELYFRRGQWYAAESQLDKALADFEQAIELLPGDKRCSLERERVVEKLGAKK